MDFYIIAFIPFLALFFYDFKAFFGYDFIVFCGNVNLHENVVKFIVEQDRSRRYQHI